MQPFASTESRVDLQVKWAVKKGLSLPPPGTYKVDKAASEWPAASFNTRYREEWREDKTQRALEALAPPGREVDTILDYGATVDTRVSSFLLPASLSGCSKTVCERLYKSHFIQIMIL